MKTITIEQFCRARGLSPCLVHSQDGWTAVAIRHGDMPATVSGCCADTQGLAMRDLCGSVSNGHVRVIPGDTMPPDAMPSGYSSEIPIDTYAYLRHKHNLTVADIMSLTGLSKDQVTYGCPELDSFFERIS